MNNTNSLKGDEITKRRSHLKNLIAIAFADRDLSPTEVKLLYELSNKMGFNGNEVAEIMKDPASVDFVLPESRREEFDQIYDLVNMMLIDGTIDSREVEICQHFIKRLGYDPVVAQEILNRITKKLSTGKNKEEIYTTIKDLIINKPE